MILRNKQERIIYINKQRAVKLVSHKYANNTKIRDSMKYLEQLES